MRAIGEERGEHERVAHIEVRAPMKGAVTEEADEEGEHGIHLVPREARAEYRMIFVAK
jgi:hypothetical protein